MIFRALDSMAFDLISKIMLARIFCQKIFMPCLIRTSRSMDLLSILSFIFYFIVSFFLLTVKSFYKSLLFNLHVYSLAAAAAAFNDLLVSKSPNTLSSLEISIACLFILYLPVLLYVIIFYFKF